MAMTLRLPDALVAEAQAFAAKLGISMNALAAVALRDYLDGRTTPRSAMPSADLPALAEPARASVPSPSYPTPRSRSDPCPCGALSPDGHRLKWKHCHGKAA